MIQNYDEFSVYTTYEDVKDFVNELIDGGIFEDFERRLRTDDGGLRPDQHQGALREIPCGLSGAPSYGHRLTPGFLTHAIHQCVYVAWRAGGGHPRHHPDSQP